MPDPISNRNGIRVPPVKPAQPNSGDGRRHEEQKSEKHRLGDSPIIQDHLVISAEARRAAREEAEKQGQAPADEPTQ